MSKTSSGRSSLANNHSNGNNVNHSRVTRTSTTTTTTTKTAPYSSNPPPSSRNSRKTINSQRSTRSSEKSTAVQPTTVRRDPINETIEGVIARSLVESHSSSSFASPGWRSTNLQQPEMRQKRQPQKRNIMNGHSTPTNTSTTTTLEPVSSATTNANNAKQSPAPPLLNHADSPVPSSSFSTAEEITSSKTSLMTNSTAADVTSFKTCLTITSPVTAKLTNGSLTNGKSLHTSNTPITSNTSLPSNGQTKRVGPAVAITSPPTDKLAGLLAKKRKWTEELSQEGGSSSSDFDRDTGHHRHHSHSKSGPSSVRVDTVSTHHGSSSGGGSGSVPVGGKKRKLEALMHRRGENTVWAWRGKSFIKTVYSKVEKRNMERTCYNAVRHNEGEVIKVGDCVLLRAPKGQEPHVGKVAAFWADERGDMMMTIFWFWRPEEVDLTIRPQHGAMEVYVSSLRDENFVSCIDEKCFVLTAHQYARFMAISKEDDTLYHRPKRPFVPTINSPINTLLPDAEIDPEIVYFANKGFDGKSNRFWDYYFRGSKLRKCYLD